MKLTAKEEYGLRCLLQIARQPGAFATIDEIASREGLTSTYVAKLLRLMRKAGLVTSIRGRRGGFRLSRSGTEISVGQVLSVLGGRLYSEQFCRSYRAHKRACVHDSDCSIRSLWAAIGSLVENATSRVMLQDLLCTTEEDMTTWCRGHLNAVAGNRPVSLVNRCSGTLNLES